MEQARALAEAHGGHDAGPIAERDLVADAASQPVGLDRLDPCQRAEIGRERRQLDPVLGEAAAPVARALQRLQHQAVAEIGRQELAHSRTRR